MELLSTEWSALQNQYQGEFRALSWPKKDPVTWRHTHLSKLDSLSFQAGASQTLYFSSPDPAVQIQPWIKSIPSENHHRYFQTGSTRSDFKKTKTPSHEPLQALNASELLNAFVIDIPENHVSTSPLHLQINWQGLKCLHQGRALFRLGKGAQLTVVEDTGPQTFAGSGSDHQDSFGNFLWICELGEGAKLNWIRLHQNHGQNWLNTDLQVGLKSHSEIQLLDFQLGGKWSRHRTHILGQGMMVKSQLFSLALLDQDHSGFRESIVEYSHPECTSEQVVKSLLAGESKSIFQGSILLHREAQKSNTDQLSQTLSLSKRAESISEPMLEIQADDVKAGHGSAFGSLNEEEQFYLQSRGLSKEASQLLLISGFAQEFFQKLPSMVETDSAILRFRANLDLKLKEMVNALPFTL